MEKFLKRSMAVTLIFLILINVVFLSNPFNKAYANSLAESNYMYSASDMQITNLSLSPNAKIGSFQSVMGKEMLNTDTMMSTDGFDPSADSLSTTETSINLDQSIANSLTTTEASINLALSGINSSSATVAATNLIENGDFELDPVQYGSWVPYYDSTLGNANFVWDEDIYHGNENVGGSTCIYGSSISAQIVNGADIQPGKKYSFSAWGKGDNIVTGESESGSFIYICQYDNSNTLLEDSIHSFTRDGSFDWDEVGLNFTAEANAAKVLVFLGLEGSGKVWYDDVSIIEATPVQSLTLSNTSLTMQTGETSQLTAAILPENATNKDIVWSVTSGSDVVSVSTTGLLEALKPGTAVVRAISDDDADKYAECSVTVLDPSTIILPADIEISDTVMHPSQPIIYITDKTNKKLYSINYDTKQTIEITFSDPPESIAFSDNELYVALLKGEHSSSWWTEDQKGAIAVIDASNLTLKEQFDINLDPSEIIIGRDGYIYVVSGSGQWTNINSYSKTTKLLKGSATIREGSSAELHPNYDRIYTIAHDGSVVIYTFDVLNGTISYGIDTMDIDSSDNIVGDFRLSPDGKYMFNSSGLILNCDIDQTKDMKFAFMLNESFTDVSFDLANNRFFTAVSNKDIYSYDYNTFNGISRYRSAGEIKNLYYRDNMLIGLSKINNNQYIIEKIDTASNSGNIPTPVVKTLQLQKNGNNFKLDYSVNDSVMDPSNTIAYITDSTNNKIASINYETGESKELSTYYSPESIAYYNDELFVGYGKQGKIEIYDAQTLALKDVIYTGAAFFDLNIGNDGYIYISSENYVGSYSRISKQEVSKLYVNETGYLEVHPILNSLYMQGDNYLYVLNYSSGSLTSQYDSPYGSAYSMYVNNRISPDGKYIFNGSGNIFTSSSDKSKDMLYFTTLNKAFSDVAFDVGNNKFFTATSNKAIYSYDYNTFNGISTYRSEGEIKNLYYRDNKLIALSKLDNNQFVIEKIDTSNNSGNIPTPVVTAIQLQKNGDKLNLNSSVNDSVMDPSKPIAYITDSTNNKIASINYETGEAKELSTYYSPGSIAYYNDELFVGYGKQGKIEIYDAQTLALKDVIYTGATFFDMNVGNDGYIYTSSKDYARSYSRTSKQEVSKLYVFEEGYLEVHPTLNSLYMSSMYVSPTDLYVLNYNAGTLTGQYDSPYHGNYSMTDNNRISPDGKYIFNGSGNIFTCSSDKSKDMLYYNTLNKSFSDVAFDVENNKFYTGVSGNLVYSYDYSTYKKIDEYSSQGAVKRLYLRNGKLIVVSGSNQGKDIIEIIDTTNPVKQVTAISINKTLTNMEIGITEQLSTTVLPENATNKDIIWSIQNGNDVASVSSTGLVTALKSGTAVVRAASAADATKYAECIITVVAAPAAQLTGFVWAKGSSSGTTRAIVIPAGTLKYAVGAANMLLQPKVRESAAAYKNTLTTYTDITVTAGQHIFIVSIGNDGTITSWADVAVDTANINSTTTGTTPVTDTPVVGGGGVSTSPGGSVSTLPAAESLPSTKSAPNNGVMTVVPSAANNIGKTVIGLNDYKALADSATVKNGIKNMTVNIDNTDLSSFDTLLPVTALTNSKKDAITTINTSIAQIEIPSNMFDGILVKDASDISISIVKLDKSALPAAVADKIGNSPVLDIFATVNGTAKTWSNAKAPVTISIPYTLKEGEKASDISVYYIDDAGNMENMQGVYNSDAKLVTFTTTHFSKYIVKANKISFTDLAGFEQYTNYIDGMASKGIIEGVGDNKYAPSKVLTRAEFATLLVKMLKLDISDVNNAFADVKSSDWYANYVNAAYNAGLISGIGAGKFAPNEVITNQDAAIILVKALKYKGVVITAESLSKVRDISEINKYAQEAVGFALSKEIITLDLKSNFNAKSTVNRAAAAKYIYNVFYYKN